MNIRPVSDLRNKYPEIEKDLAENKEIYLTKNGYGVAVIMELKEYSRLAGIAATPNARRAPMKRNSDRGFLSAYANAELIPLEKNAGRMHVSEKFRQKGGNI